MIAVARVMLAVVLAAIVFDIIFLPRQKHRPLDPDEPIAADGSMNAGKARTIYDTNPMLRADADTLELALDDPARVQADLQRDRSWAERERGFIKSQMGPLDWSRCKEPRRDRLLTAIRDYYGLRGRQKDDFLRRGPHGQAAIAQEWTTPADREIDDFVRHAVQYGIVHKDDLPANSFPEFVRITADIEESGDGCPRSPR